MDPIVIEAHLSGDQGVLNLAAEIRELDAAHQTHREELLFNLATATDKAKHPFLNFSEIFTLVDAAPDEESQLLAVMTRLAKRGEYDSLAVQLAIATVGPHDTDAIANLLDTLNFDNIRHSTTASGQILVHCVACEEQLPAKNLTIAPCGHCYCGPCTSIMFNTAVTDESCYPPRCCTNIPIPIEHVKRFLDADFEILFEEKGVEFATIDRTYCSNPECSTFIPPAQIEEDEEVEASCSRCWSRTCVTCKAPAHGGDCPTDSELAATLELAEEMRWQRCYKCLRIVERQDGCNFMECRCGAYFCYICGRKMVDEEPCLCFRDDPPVYRLFRPYISPDPSDDGSQPTRSVVGEGPMVWETEHFIDEPPNVTPPDDEPPNDYWRNWDNIVDANREQSEAEYQLRFEEVEAPLWDWTPAGTPQIISDDIDEGFSANESSSILERLADFLNF